jgi:hypothetical protein
MRSPFTIALAAAGFSAWARVDFQARPFVEGLFASLSQDASGITYSVEHTPDNPDLFVPCTISVSGTTATLGFATNHGLVANDSVIINNSQGQLASGYDGTYAVASTPSDSTLTVTVATGGPASAALTSRASLCRVFADATLAAKTARAYAANTVPVLATRLHNTAWTAGTTYLEIVQGHARG